MTVATATVALNISFEGLLLMVLSIMMKIEVAYSKQEDLLDLITALLKFNCFLSITVATQCIFQSNL